MSMNINAVSYCGNIKIWQTPTQISYTILPPNIQEATGQEAKDALERYIQWVIYSINGVHKSLDEITEAKKVIEEHVRYIKSHISDEGLRVFVM